MPRTSVLYLAVFFLSFFQWIESIEYTQHIDALLLIDSRNNLRHSVKQDSRLMRSLLQEISKATHMQLNLKVIEGDQVYTSNVQAWIDSLKTSPHDVIIFYFSGHGCKNASSLIPWPNLLFSGKSGALVAFGSIIKSIEALDPRLSIVLADCCNGSMMQKSFIGCMAAREHHPRPTPDLSLGANILFKSTRGHIRATAAVPGQNALAFSKGSLFTLALNDALTKNCTTSNTSWKNVFYSISSLCKEYQKPYISLDVY